MTNEGKHGEENGNNANLARIKSIFSDAADVQIQPIYLDENLSRELYLVYSTGLCDTALISQSILPQLAEMVLRDDKEKNFTNFQYGLLPLHTIPSDATPDTIAELIFSGKLIILLPKASEFLYVDISKIPQRSPAEPATEISIKGPRDGFVEDLETNVALIRKRIRSQSLACENWVLGRRTKTKVSLLYFSDIINPDLLEDVRQKLGAIDIDGLYTVNQLENMLVKRKYSLFPLMDYTGRPDKVIHNLLDGRFVLLLDGNPMVLIGPVSFFELVKSPEDLFFDFQYVTFTRAVRFISLFITTLIPGIWVGLTSFHPDQIPYTLLATIGTGRMGLPFSGQVEFLIILLFLEIFREAGLRLPNNIGQTLSVVGGIIIGDAAIRAGLISPSVVVVGGITVIAGITLVNQSLAGIVSIVRLFLFFMAAILGMYGLIIGLILVIAYVSGLRSFGVSYLAPLSPFSFKDALVILTRIPWNKQKQRSEVLKVVDPDHAKDEDSEKK